MSAIHANHSQQSSASPSAAHRPERRGVPRDKLILGVAALTIWILLFAAGLLIETVEYRLVLAPRSVGKQIGDADVTSITGSNSAAASSEATGASQRLASSKALPFSPWYSFFASVICFTPINLAILTLTAGLLGGCASNITIETMPDARRAALQKEHPQRHLYLQEPPVSAAIRGFVVFLCVIAGLYVAMDDPFKDPTPGQYIRLAGMLSILALVVGYDASRLEDWLRIIPGPGTMAGRGANGQQPAAKDAEQPQSGGEASIPGTQQEAAEKEAAAEKILASNGNASGGN